MLCLLSIPDISLPSLFPHFLTVWKVLEIDATLSLIKLGWLVSEGINSVNKCYTKTQSFVCDNNDDNIGGDGVGVGDSDSDDDDRNSQMLFCELWKR